MTTSPQAIQQTSPARTRVFSYLYDSGAGRTKREIASDLDLSLPTVYAALTALEEDGLIAASTTRPSTGGRPATSFAVNAGGAHALGISITGSLVRTAVCDLLGNEVHTREERRSFHGSLDDLRQGIEQALGEAMQESSKRDARLIGAAVALPAVIAPGSTQVANARELGLEPFDGATLTQGLPLPALLLNDASCGGFAEVTGTGRDAGANEADPSHTNAAFLSLENGVGGAVLIGGRPFAGMNGRSAEFGHICVEPGGHACSCGKHGCLQAYCSARVLAQAADGNLDAFFQALGAGEKDAATTWDDFADHLARGIASLRVTLDSDVILGGMLAPYLETRLDDIRARTLGLLPFDDSADFVRIARHPRFGVPLGAARTVMAQYVGEV